MLPSLRCTRAGQTRGRRAAGLGERAGDLDRLGLPPRPRVGNDVGVRMHHREVTRPAEVEDGLEQRVRGVLGRGGSEPAGEVPQLALPAHTALAGLGDPAQQRQHRGDRAHGALAQPFRLAEARLGADEPVRQAPPTARASRLRVLRRPRNTRSSLAAARADHASRHRCPRRARWRPRASARSAPGRS